MIAASRADLVDNYCGAGGMLFQFGEAVGRVILKDSQSRAVKKEEKEGENEVLNCICELLSSIDMPVLPTLCLFNLTAVP